MDLQLTLMASLGIISGRCDVMLHRARSREMLNMDGYQYVGMLQCIYFANLLKAKMFMS